jgi:hypothetical protein
MVALLFSIAQLSENAQQLQTCQEYDNEGTGQATIISASITPHVDNIVRNLRFS